MLVGDEHRIGHAGLADQLEAGLQRGAGTYGHRIAPAEDLELLVDEPGHARDDGALGEFGHAGSVVNSISMPAAAIVGPKSRIRARTHHIRFRASRWRSDLESGFRGPARGRRSSSYPR